ncbi:MAG: hypothetical protein JWQ73_1417, partial [Variovorax sp.]|nr:hypothetical protein [Variovorax sp.]
MKQDRNCNSYQHGSGDTVAAFRVR